MKNILVLILLALVLSWNAVSAQIEFEFDDVTVMEDEEKTNSSTSTSLRVYESDESMSKGIQNALVIELEVADNKLVEKVWKSFMKDYEGKTKRAKGGNGEYLTSGTEIVGINGVRPIGVHSKVTTASSGNSELMVWFNLGDTYLESHQREQYNEAEELLLKFAHEVKTEHTRIELKEAEKNLRNMEGDLKQLLRQNEGYHRDIEEAEKRIERAKGNIAKNQDMQEDTGKKIELQKLLVEEIERRYREMRNQ